MPKNTKKKTHKKKHHGVMEKGWKFVQHWVPKIIAFIKHYAPIVKELIITWYIKAMIVVRKYAPIVWAFIVKYAQLTFAWVQKEAPIVKQKIMDFIDKQRPKKD
jgi:phage-related protein